MWANGPSRVARRAVHVDQAGLAGQHDGGEDVVGAPGHRDDVALDHLGAVRVEGVANRR